MVELITAAKNGYKTKLDILLQNGHLVDCRDDKQATALFWGACRGHDGICASLLLAGADINARVNWGATPLHAAADNGQGECIKVLLKFHADINAQNNRGDTPLHLACYRGFTDIVSLLLKSGADITLENCQGKNPYIEADGQKHIAVLKILEPQMIHLKRKNARITQQVPPQANIYYSTECFQNSLNSSSYSGNNMRTISFSRQSEAQENEDRVGSPSDMDSVSAKMNILNLDRDAADDANLSYHNSMSTQDMLSQQRLPYWATESVDCSRSEQRQIKYQPQMQEMLRSLSEQNSLIQKLREENEKLTETAYQRELERKRADDNCQKLVLQLSRSRQNPTLSFSDDSNSVSDLSSPSDLSASPLSPNHLFPYPKYPSVSAPPGSGYSSVNSGCNVHMGSNASSDPRNFSHKSVLELYQQIPDSKLLDFGLLTKKVSDIWLRGSEHNVQFNQIDCDEMTHGHYYEFRDSSPLNRKIGEQGEGTNSLVFRIKYKNRNLILKMMMNLLDLHEYGHDQGFSLNNYLHYHYGPEVIPTDLPPHRNLIKIIHHYRGTTYNFQQFHNLAVPPGIDGLEMARRTLFIVMPEYPLILKTFMETTLFNSCLEPFLLQQLYQLLSVVYLLAKNHIVHRDIKSDNIFLDSRLRPILADFGMAKKLSEIPVINVKQIHTANNLSWTPEMIRWKYSVDPLTNLTEEDVYRCTDSYSIGRMFHEFFMTETQKFPEVTSVHPHFRPDDIPDLPSYLSPGLRYVLRKLVLDRPSDRMTIRKAMLCTGMLLFPPSPDEITQKLSVKHYLQAKLMTLLVLKPTVFPFDGVQTPLTVEDSIQQNAQELEADFLCNVTVDEFWDIYQEISFLNSNQTNLNDLS